MSSEGTRCIEEDMRLYEAHMRRQKEEQAKHQKEERADAVASYSSELARYIPPPKTVSYWSCWRNSGGIHFLLLGVGVFVIWFFLKLSSPVSEPDLSGVDFLCSFVIPFCLCATGYWLYGNEELRQRQAYFQRQQEIENEKKRQYEELARRQKEERAKAASSYTGDAFAAACATPTNHELVALAKEQEKNYRDLFHARAASTQAASWLMRVKDEQQQLEIEREIGRKRQEIELATLENQHVQVEYAGERIPFEHEVEVAKLEHRRRRLRTMPVRHSKPKTEAEEVRQRRRPARTAARKRAVVEMGQARSQKIEQEFEDAKHGIERQYELDVLQQQLDLQKKAKAREWLYHWQKELTQKYGEEVAARMVDEWQDAEAQDRLFVPQQG